MLSIDVMWGTFRYISFYRNFKRRITIFLLEPLSLLKYTKVWLCNDKAKYVTWFTYIWVMSHTLLLPVAVRYICYICSVHFRYQQRRIQHITCNLIKIMLDARCRKQVEHAAISNIIKLHFLEVVWNVCLGSFWIKYFVMKNLMLLAKGFEEDGRQIFLLGVGNLRMSDFDHSNLFQS